jgi:hypothetical protein
MFFLWSLNPYYDNLLEQFRSCYKVLKSATVDSIVANIHYHNNFKLIVGTLDNGYLHKILLPRAPQIQSPGHLTCATVTARNKRDTCYLQVPHIPTWSDLVRSHAGFARNTMLLFTPVCLM